MSETFLAQNVGEPKRLAHPAVAQLAVEPEQRVVEHGDIAMKVEVLEGSTHSRHGSFVNGLAGQNLVVEQKRPCALATCPVMALNSVVLPAPFDPIKPVTAPASISNETPSTALTPPNVTAASCDDELTPAFAALETSQRA